MPKYTIIVRNESQQNQRYMLFNEPPEHGSIGTPYSNVWQVAPGVGFPRGKATFTFTENYFAVCGRTLGNKELAEKVKIDTTDSFEVSLCTASEKDKKKGDDVNMGLVKEGFSFIAPHPKTVDLPGSFGIQTKGFTPSAYEDAWCGLGRYNADHEVEACVAWRAWPNMNYVVTPVSKFYIATGEYEAGTVVNKTTFSTVATIDFTGRDETVAIVTQDKTNAFGETKYKSKNSESDE